MLARWTELLPVFLFRLVARRCGTIPWNGVAWHDARPGIAVREEESWVGQCVRIYTESVLKQGISHAEAQWGHFPDAVKEVAIRDALQEIERKMVEGP